MTKHYMYQNIPIMSVAIISLVLFIVMFILLLRNWKKFKATYAQKSNPATPLAIILGIFILIFVSLGSWVMCYPSDGGEMAVFTLMFPFFLLCVTWAGALIVSLISMIKIMDLNKMNQKNVNYVNSNNPFMNSDPQFNGSYSQNNLSVNCSSQVASVPSSKDNTSAMVSLILGILSWACFCSLFTAIPGLIVGITSLKAGKTKGLCIAGIILSSLSILFVAGFWVWAFVLKLFGN